MTVRFSSLRGAGAWLLAMLMTLAVTLLWLPQRPEARGQSGERPADARLLAAPAGLVQPGQLQRDRMLRDKGPVPRAALLAAPSPEDRSTGTAVPPPGLAPPAALPGRLTRGASHLPVAPPHARAPSGGHGPRAPPLA